MKSDSLLIKSLILFLSCFIFSPSIYCTSTNPILKTADSLVYKGKFKEMKEQLLPLESLFANESDINKYHYYGLLAAYYIRENDYKRAIPFLEKKAQYNHVNIDDLYLLANLYSTKYKNPEKATRYAQKALLLDDEITNLGYVKDYDYTHIARLHYILGILACHYGNKVLALDYFKWIKKNDGYVDHIHLKHLAESIDSLSEMSLSIDADQIRDNALSSFNDWTVIKESRSNIRFAERYLINSRVELDSILSLSDINMTKYLNTVFYIEDNYDESQIDQSASLLKQAYKVTADKEFYTLPSIELCELYMRLGKLDFFLKNYNSAIKWFLLVLTNSRKLNSSIGYNVQALGEIADIYLEQGEMYKSLMYADEMLDELIRLKSATNLNQLTIQYICRYANVLSQTGFIYMAEKLYKWIIETVPDDTVAYRLACNNYATYLFLHNRKDEACHYYLLIRDKFPSLQSISNLAMAYLYSNNIQEADYSFQDYYKKNLSLLENVLVNFTEPKWHKFWGKYGFEFYISSNYLAYNIHTTESLINGYNATIISKNLPLLHKLNVDQILSSSETHDIQDLYRQYVFHQQKLSEGIDNDSIRSLTIHKIEILEDSLQQELKFNGYGLKNMVSDYSLVVNSLAQDEVAIEFCHYLDLCDTKESMSYKYAAYIIDPKRTEPIFVIIGNEIDLSNLIFNSRKDELTINQLYSSNEIGNLIWGEILPYIKTNI